MSTERMIRLAVSCYPRWWRDRYADEVCVHAQDMVADGRAPLTLLFSLLVGAARSRWTAQGMPMDYRQWSMRNRVSIAGAILTWVLVAPLAAMSTGSEKVGLQRTFVVRPYHVPALLPTAPAAHLVTYCSLAMLVIVFITLLLLMVGWSHLCAGIRTSGGPVTTRTVWLARVPVIAILVYVAGAIPYWIVIRPSAYMISGRNHHITYLNGHPGVAHVAGFALTVIGVGGWLLSIACIAGVSAKG